MQKRFSILGPVRGFALIAVLSSLTMVALLFAISSRLTLASQSFYATEKRILETQQETAMILRLIGNIDREDALRVFDSWEASVGSRGFVRLQDVGGLIDLNTTTPDVISRLVQEFGGTTSKVANYFEWRRSGHRLYRIGDFLNFFSISANETTRLQSVATLFSGRRTFDGAIAPLQVYDATGWVPEESVSGVASKSDNFAVYATDRSGNYETLLGSINFGTGVILAAD